jgi:perosamine synthetase
MVLAMVSGDIEVIPVAKPFLTDDETKNVLAALRTGWISSKGKFISRFEDKFSQYCDVKYAVSTSNGTAALHLALTALGIGAGDEVIVPTLTFIATANSVTYTGAKPVFVDSRRDYWCIDPDKISERVTRRTKAIIPVHLYGHPCDMDAISDVAREHKLLVVEDASEAHGAEFRSRKIGSFGDVSCFSFYGNKTITTGEGGMCLTNSRSLARRLRILRDHGMNPSKPYWHDVIGFNYRMTNLQAAIGLAQTKKLDILRAKKRHLASLYNLLLANTPRITLPPEMPWALNTYWMYSILVKGKSSSHRDNLIRHLAKSGIETRPFFYPVHTLPPYRKVAERLPVAEDLGRRGISLPNYVGLKLSEVKTICKAVREFQAEYA